MDFILAYNVKLQESDQDYSELTEKEYCYSSRSASKIESEFSLQFAKQSI